MMKWNYGANEISSSFDCKRRRSSDECVQCASRSRYFHHACNAELRDMFAHNPESESDAPIAEGYSSPTPPLAEACDASMRKEIDRPAMCLLCEAGDLVEYVSHRVSLRNRPSNVSLLTCSITARRPSRQGEIWICGMPIDEAGATTEGCQLSIPCDLGCGMHICAHQIPWYRPTRGVRCCARQAH